MTGEDWNAVGAIGQWFGGLATAAAVIIALRAEKRARDTRVEVTVSQGPNTVGRRREQVFVINALNKSGRQIIIDSVGIKLPDSRDLGSTPIQTLLGDIRDLEKKQGEFAISTVAGWLENQGFTQPLTLRFYVQDTTGKLHWCGHRFDPTPYRARVAPPQPPAANDGA